MPIMLSERRVKKAEVLDDGDYRGTIETRIPHT